MVIYAKGSKAAHIQSTQPSLPQVPTAFQKFSYVALACWLLIILHMRAIWSCCIIAPHLEGITLNAPDVFQPRFGFASQVLLYFLCHHAGRTTPSPTLGYLFCTATDKSMNRSYALFCTPVEGSARAPKGWTRDEMDWRQVGFAGGGGGVVLATTRFPVRDALSNSSLKWPGPEVSPLPVVSISHPRRADRWNRAKANRGIEKPQEKIGMR